MSYFERNKKGLEFEFQRHIFFHSKILSKINESKLFLTKEEIKELASSQQCTIKEFMLKDFKVINSPIIINIGYPWNIEEKEWEKIFKLKEEKDIRIQINANSYDDILFCIARFPSLKQQASRFLLGKKAD